MTYAVGLLNGDEFLVDEVDHMRIPGFMDESGPYIFYDGGGGIITVVPEYQVAYVRKI